MKQTLLSFVSFSVLALLPASLSSQIHAVDANRLVLRAAKTVYFDDQTRINTHIGEKARSELKKWGRYKILDDPTKADLILLLSLHRYEDGYNVHSDRTTAATNIHGQSQEALAPSYNRRSAQAYLTAIDPATGRPLWSESRQWGGMLTGFDSVGVRLLKKFEKAAK